MRVSSRRRHHAATPIFELHQRIGLFVALIVTNCAVLGRAESFARKQSIGLAAFDGLMMGLGFCLAIVLLGTVREVIGQGRRWPVQTLSLDHPLLIGKFNFHSTVFSGGSTARSLFGLMIASKNWVDSKLEQRQTIRNPETA